MKNLLAHVKPWHWIVLALGGCFMAVAFLCAGGLTIDEDVPGLTYASVHSPHQVTTDKGMGIREVHALLAKSMRAASIQIHDNEKGRIKSASDAASARAKICKKYLPGTGVCHGGDNQAIADCLTAFLKNQIGTADFPLDEPSPNDPAKTGRQLVCDTYDRVAIACDKLSK